jgi:hypothetical protein
MMWNVMTYGGPTISLSAPDAAGAARLFAMTHGMPSDVRLESHDNSCSLFSSGKTPIVVSRGPVFLDEAHSAALDLHKKLGLPDDDASYDIIELALENMSGATDYANYN